MGVFVLPPGVVYAPQAPPAFVPVDLGASARNRPHLRGDIASRQMEYLLASFIHASQSCAVHIG
jgi:hypothetical protein